MIKGIGTDIIEIERVLKAIKSKSFIKKCYTSAEEILCEKSPKSYASNFAVKEAVAKALGTGFRGFMPCDIEVLRNSLGQPYVNLYGKAKSLANDRWIDNIHVSISHNKTDVVAYVILE